MTYAKQHPPTTTEAETFEDVLQHIETGRERETVTLRSGRRFELESGEHTDRIVVRSSSGHVLLRVAVGDDGPLLSFESAEITLSARNKLALSAPTVAIEADALHTASHERTEEVRGDRHTRIAGEERLEASAVAIQANDKNVSMRAMERVALDADHIGLNDMPCPTPFDWSSASEEMEMDR